MLTAVNPHFRAHDSRLSPAGMNGSSNKAFEQPLFIMLLYLKTNGRAESLPFGYQILDMPEGRVICSAAAWLMEALTSLMLEHHRHQCGWRSKRIVTFQHIWTMMDNCTSSTSRSCTMASSVGLLLMLGLATFSPWNSSFSPYNAAASRKSSIMQPAMRL